MALFRKIIKTARKVHSSMFFWHGISRRNRIAFALFVIILISFASLYVLNAINPQRSEAAWFDDNWGYRQTVAITNSGSAQTDYQVAIALDTATLITAGKMRSNCNDLRITDTNGRLLPHWVEGGAPGCNNSATEIWVKTSSIPTSGATVYIYYGNPSATNSEKPEQVFLLFDNFKNVDTSKWKDTTGTNTIISSGYDNLAMSTSGDANDIRFFSVASMSAGYAVKARMMEDGTDGGLFFDARDDANGYLVTSRRAGGTSAFEWYKRASGSWTSLSQHNSVSSWTSTEYRTLEVKRVGTVITTKDNETSISYTTNGDPTFDGGSVGIRANAQQTIDWIFVRKAAATEPSVGSPSGEEKAPSPVAYWKFDDATGTNAQDSTTNNNDGTITAATWQTEDMCVAKKCLYFDGTNDYVTVTDSNSLDFGTGDFTASAWVRTNTTSTARIIYKYNTDTTRGFMLTINETANKVSLLLWATGGAGQAQVNSTSAINDGKWHYIVGVRSGTTNYIYVDGKQENSASGATSDVSGASNLFIGIDVALANDYTGFIDEPKIYNYARSAAQVKLDYASRGSIKGVSASIGSSDQWKSLSDGLVGYWKMDESSWTVDCSTTSVTDSSGNGNNGAACPATTGPAGGAAGKFGNAGSFDGSNDYISIAHSSVLKPASQITISAWVKPTSATLNALREIYRKEDGTDRHLLSFQNSPNCSGGGGTGGCIAFGISTGGTYAELDVNVASADWEGTWHHVIATYDGTTKRLYRDGVEIGSAAATGSIGTTGTAASIIGSNGGTSEFFSGPIDETRIYNRALTPSEVEGLYNFAPGPVGYWSFDERSGLSAADKSGNGNAAAFGSGTAAPTWTSGKYGGAVSFDGTNDEIVVTDATVLKLAPAGVSVGAWIYLRQTVSGCCKTVVAKESGNNGYALNINPDTGTNKAQFAVGDGTDWANDVRSTTTLAQNKWYHIMGTYNPDDQKTRIYINGVLEDDTPTAAGAMQNTTTNLGIGESVGYPGREVNAIIDDARIYNYARSAKQIVQDMNAGHPAVGSPVGSAVGYWKFDEGADNTCSGGTNDACNSGNGGSTLDGSNSGATWQMSGKFGKALAFDGSDDYVAVTSPTGLPLGSSSRSITAWIKVDDRDNYNSIFRYGAETTRNMWAFTTKQTTGELLLASYDDDVTADTPVSLGVWHFVAAVWNGTNLTFYLDGRADGVKTFTGTPNTTSTALRIGTNLAGGANAFFDGTIDEVKIYSYALTAGEVKLDMNRQSSQVLGALSDTSGLTGGSTASNSAQAEYCIPGDTTSCAAPVGRWDFEEGQGSTVNDTSGNANTGTITNALWTKGKYGAALSFDGNGDYVSLTNAPTTGTGSFSAFAWIKTSNTGARKQIFMWGNDAGTTNDGAWLFVNTSNQVAFDLSNVAGTNSSVTVSDGQWHFVGVVNNAGTIQIYVDGRTSGSSVSMSPNLGSTYKCIGTRCSSTSTWTFNGQIDQARIFDYARSAAQVAWDYNRGAPVGWWKFDECQGTTANDSSGNGNTGTITIAALGTQTSAGTCTTTGTAWKNGVTGKRNYSLNLDGTDDYVDGGSPSILPTGANARTVSAWIKASTIDTDWRIVAAWGAEVANQAFGILSRTQAGGKWGCYLYGGANDVYSNTEIQTGTWYHTICTYDGTNVRLYLNGNLETTAARTPNTASGNLKIGRRQTSAGGYFPGQIDDVKIYNYALTGAQVKELYNQGAVNFAPSQGAP